jgi:hypothetical protein
VLRIGLAGEYRDHICNPDHIFDLHNANEADLFREKFELVHLPYGEQDTFELQDQADAYVSGGLFYRELKLRYPDAPIVEIRMTGCDLYGKIIECNRRFGSRKVGIIAPHAMLLGLNYALDALGAMQMEARHYDITDFDQRRPLLEQAIAEGCDAILSSSTVCQFAEERGLVNMPLQMRADSFYNSISAAKRVALLARRGKTSTARRGVVLDYSVAAAIAAAQSGGLALGPRTAAKTWINEATFYPFPEVEEERGMYVRVGSRRGVSFDKALHP